MTKAKPGARRGRRPSRIETDPQRFEIAAWHAFCGDGCGPFDAARRALLAIRGGPITVEDIEGVLHRATAVVPLPNNPDDPDEGLRRLAAKAQRAKPEPWLISSAALVQAAIVFIRASNTTGIAIAFDGLIRLGWGPTIMGLVQRVEAALGSNLPPAALAALGPEARKQVEMAGVKLPKRRHRKK